MLYKQYTDNENNHMIDGAIEDSCCEECFLCLLLEYLYQYLFY